MKFKAKSLSKLIGPFPYNPTFIFLFFFAVSIARFIPAITGQPRGVKRYIAALVVIALASLPSALFAAAAFLVQKYRFWNKNNLFYYILEVAFGQSIIIICIPLTRRIITGHYHVKYEVALALTPGLFLGSLFLALIALALIHQAERKITNQLSRADELVKKLDADRRELILADEELRNQTSQFLHDRVQSDLMVVSMTLSGIQNDLKQSQREILKSAQAKLENIRVSDLRNLVQILSPNFSSSGFIVALKELKGQYQFKSDIQFELSELAEELTETQKLGIFRVTEQSLLNSLVHGGSTEIKIRIHVDDQNRVSLSITDNGQGADLAKATSGVGTTVIDSWVSILKAEKAVRSNPGDGYSLQLAFMK